MRPRSDRRKLGWDDSARVFLIASAAILGSALAWKASGHRDGEVDLPSLSVDANSAPGPVLGALPGLGPVLAGRIIEARPFRSMDDFDRRVYGIGPAKVAALRPFLRFEPPPDGPTP